MPGFLKPYIVKSLSPAAQRVGCSQAQIFSERNNNHITGIQYLRGLAAMMVVFTHIGGTATIPKYFGVNLLNGAYGGGAAGVHLFFVISGFIILYVSLSGRSLEKKVSPAKFLQKRFIRVIPFMWMCIIGHGFLMLAGRANSQFPILAYLRSLCLFPIGEVLPNQTWTIKHEVLFYLIFCTTVLLLNKGRLLLLVWVVSPLFWYLLTNSVQQYSLTLIELGNFLFSSFNILFGIGLLIGWLTLHSWRNIRWRTKNGFLVCFCCCLILFLAANWLLPFYANKLVYNTALGLLSGVIVLTAISLGSEKPTGRLNEFGLLLGNASYSIYLTHCAIISCIYGLWAKFQKSPNPILLVLITGLCCCVVGIIIHKTIEKPVIALLKSRIGNRMSKVREMNSHSSASITN